MTREADKIFLLQDTPFHDSDGCVLKIAPPLAIRVTATLLQQVD